jgi:hypothetical protein
MIVKEADGGRHLDFCDWNPVMMATASRLHQLPLPPGREDRDHEWGIDRLARMKHGHWMVVELSYTIDVLDYCPDADEIVRMGQALLLLKGEMNDLARAYRIERIRHRAQVSRARSAQRLKMCQLQPQTKPKFRRGA